MKNTKCNIIKKKDCDTKSKLKKKVDGVSKGKLQDFCHETCNPTLCESPSTSPSERPSESPSEPSSVFPSESRSGTTSVSPSAVPSATPNDEVTCEDNSLVQFKVPNINGKKKNIKCNKIKNKDCGTKFKFKKKADVWTSLVSCNLDRHVDPDDIIPTFET